MAKSLITVICPHCQGDVCVDPAWGGQVVDCPLCNGAMLLPKTKSGISWKCVTNTLGQGILGVCGGVALGSAFPGLGTIGGGIIGGIGGLCSGASTAC